MSKNTDGLSFSEIQEIISETLESLREDKDFDTKAAKIKKQWGGELPPEEEFDAFEFFGDAGDAAEADIKDEFGDDEFAPFGSLEDPNMLRDLEEDEEVGQKGLFRPQDSEGNDIRLKSLVTDLEGKKKGRVMGFGDDGSGNMIARVEWAWPIDMKFMAPDEMGEKQEPLTNLIVQGLNEGDSDYGNDKLRGVRVTYADGTVIPTSMAAHLTDDEIRDYFKVGSLFNIGSLEDNMQAVDSVEIVREDEEMGDDSKTYDFDKKSLYNWFQDAMYQLGDFDEAEAAFEMEKAFNRDYDYKLKMNEMSDKLKMGRKDIDGLDEPKKDKLKMGRKDIDGLDDPKKEKLKMGRKDIDGIDEDTIEEMRGLGKGVKNSGDRNVKQRDDNHSAPTTNINESIDNSIKTLMSNKVTKKGLKEFISEEAKKVAKNLKR